MEPLEIVVTGNVDGARTGLQAIQGELGKTALTTKSAGAAFDEMAAKMANFQRAAKNSLNPELVAVYNNKVKELQASMKVLASQADAEALSVENATVNMAKMTAVTGTASVGHQRLASAIARATDPLQIAAREVNNFSRRLLYMAGAGVMQLAIQGFELILPYIEEFVSGLDKSSVASKLAAANIANLNDINKAAAEETAQQTASLSTLYSIATDVTRSMYARTNAVKELQKEFPDYFKNISQENILNGSAKSAYDALTNSLIANALAKAQLDKITKIGISRADDQSDVEALTAEKNRRLAAVKSAETSEPSIGSSTGATPTTLSIQQQKDDINTYFDRQLIPLKSQIKSFDAQIDNIKGRLNPEALLSGDGKENANNDKPGVLAAFDAQIKVLKDYKNNIATTAQEIASVNAQIKSLEAERAKFDPTKPKKGKDPFEIDLKALEDNYKEAQSLLVQQYDANATDAKKNTTAVNDLLLKAQETFLEQKLALIKQYGKKEGEVDLEIAKNNKALVENQLGFKIDQINTLPKVENAPKINPKVTTEKVDPKVYYQLSDSIQAAIKSQAQMQELLQNTADVLNKTLGPAFDTLFTGILEGSHNAFKAFGDAIKQMLVQLAAAVIKAAIFAGILSLISGGASTATTGAAAAAASRGGQSFSDMFSGSLKGIFGFSKGGEVKGYATGGMISGPGTNTSDSILARLSKGEYIMNASTVSKFGTSFFDSINSGLLPKFNRGGAVGSNMILASDNHVFIPEVTLKGQDLIIAFNRANQRASRNG